MSHREAKFSSNRELEAFIENRREVWEAARLGKHEVTDYVVDRRSEGDREWVDLLNDPPSGFLSGWREKCDARLASR